MLFHKFSSQEERRKFGGSCFIEMQYCRLPHGAKIEQLVSVDEIVHWEDDSLYIHGDDDHEFISGYGEIFTGGVYNNRKSGMVDVLGINYYAPELTRLILARIIERKSAEDQMLLQWLELATEYNGFYILGY